jgi:hypothetical protein
MIGMFNVGFGLFAKARKDADDFCHNLFLSYAMNECALQLVKVEEEYEDALLRDDAEMIEQKKLEIQTYQSSMSLTAYMFDQTDEIST